MILKVAFCTLIPLMSLKVKKFKLMLPVKAKSWIVKDTSWSSLINEPDGCFTVERGFTTSLLLI